MTERYTPADGEPVDMSKVTLGPRYGSEDMYRDMGLKLGDRVAVEKDGVIFTDQVQSVHYSSSEPAIYPRLSLRQRIVRRLTPQRWRKPLQPVRPSGLPTVELGLGTSDDPVARHGHAMEDINSMLGKFKP